MTASVILLGPPGAGKGTQAASLVHDLGFRHVNSGSLLRDEVRRNTTIGQAANRYMAQGELVPDSVVADLVLTTVNRLGGDYLVIDGFPKTVAQADLLDQALAIAGSPVCLVLALVAGRHCLKERILARAKSEGRADDTPAVIEARLRTFGTVPEDLIAHYAGRGLLSSIDAEAPLASVSDTVRGLVQAALSTGFQSNTDE